MRADRFWLFRCLTRFPAAASVLLPAAVLAGLLTSTTIAHGFSWSLAKERRTLQLLKNFQTLQRVPSLAFSITVGGCTVLERSIDPDGKAVPHGQNIRYRIGSVTKQFTAAAILAMIEDKTIVPATGAPLTLDTTLGDIFPDDVDRRSNLGKVTVRRLLTMTSNIPNYTDDPAQLSTDVAGTAPASMALGALQIVQRLKSYKLTGAPGAFEYSNTNYFVLALIIHILNGGSREPSDVPSQSYMHRRILAKAGMTRSGFVGEPTSSGDVDATPTVLYSPQFNEGSWPKGAGDLVSTAADMARWNVALMSGKVIGPGSVRTMLTPATPAVNSGPYRGCMYAMGWYACDRPGYRVFQHDGVFSGFMASNAIARQSNGSWMSATVLGNIDATTDIVTLVRSIVQIAD